MFDGLWRLAPIITAGIALILGSAATPVQTEGSAPLGSAPDRLALLVDIDGVIGPATADYVADAFAEARERGAALMILRIDTPGGLVDSMRAIVRSILAADVPVAAYVGPSGARAASAGTYILYASHVAAMAPGTNLGAATPVRIGGSPGPRPDAPADEEDADDLPDDPMSTKAINDAAAYIRSLAKLRDRNAEWAERAVREASSLTANEALEQDVIDLIAGDLDQLLARIDGMTVAVANGQEVTLNTTGLVIERVEPGWQIRLLSIITNPNVAFLLMMIGVYGLIFELATPGSIGPGVIGAISLVLGLYALSVLPLNAVGLALLGLGVVCMVAEAFVPSFGVLGIGGAVAFAFGASLLFDIGVPGLDLAWPVIAGATVFSLGLLIFALAYVWRAHRRPSAAGDDRLRRSRGEVVDWAGGRGFVSINGECWQATGPGSLTPGTAIRVVERKGLMLIVEPAGQSSKGAEP